MQVHAPGLSQTAWPAPVRATPGVAVATEPADRVDLRSPAQVLSNPNASPEHLLQALGSVATDVAFGPMLPAPTLQAILRLMQRVRAGSESDRALGESLTDHLTRWSANGQLSVQNASSLEELARSGRDFRVIGMKVYGAPPEDVPRADLVEAFETGSEQKLWSNLHRAGRAQLKALSDRLEREPRLPSGLQGQAGEMHRRILVAFPEKADEDYLQKHLKPAMLGGRDTLDTVAHFYGCERVLSELLPRAGERGAETAVNDALELTLLEQKAGFSPSQESLERMVRLTVEEAGRFESHHSLVGRGTACLAREIDRLSAHDRLSFQKALLEHPQPGWPVGLALERESTARVATGTPELQANLWNNEQNPVAQALLVGSYLDDRDWARLGLLLRQSDEREPRLIREAYQRRSLHRKLGRLEPAQAARQLDELRKTTGVEDEARGNQILMQRLLQDFPPGQFPRLQRAAGWIHDIRPFVPIFKQAALDGTTATTFRELEGLLARQGVGIISGHEDTICELYQSKGERSLEEVERRFNRVGSVCPDSLGSSAGGPQRLALLRLLEGVPTEDLERSDNPVLGSLGGLLASHDPGQILGLLETLDAALPRRGQVVGVLERLKQATRADLDTLAERARTLAPEQLDRTLELLASPLRTADSLALAPLVEQLHAERGQRAHAEGLTFVSRLCLGSMEDRRTAAETGLRRLLAGDDLASVLALALKGMTVPEAGPAAAIVQDGSSVRIGAHRLMIKRRAG